MMATSSEAWRALRGVMSVYKPSGVPIRRVINITQMRLVNALNSLRNNELLQSFEKNQKERNLIDYSRHPLVIGNSFTDEDVHLNPILPISQNAGGICLIALNDLSSKKRIAAAKWLRTYRIEAELGKTTDTGFVDGRILSRSRQPFLKQHHVSKALAAIAGSHQKQAIVMSGLQPQSQECYEMAVRGLLRPGLVKRELSQRSESDHQPLVYGLRCLELDPLRASFELEVQCLDAPLFFLLQLVADIGTRLKTDAACRTLRCIRIGLFKAEDALTLNEIDMQSVIDNVSANNKLLSANEHLLPSMEDIQAPALPNLVSAEDAINKPLALPTSREVLSSGDSEVIDQTDERSEVQS